MGNAVFSVPRSMEALRELRIPMQLDVRVWGMDSDGKPFSQMARTVDISGRGARLAGINSPKQHGDIIGVQHGDQKARFQVMWVGEEGTAAQGQIGIQCMDAGRCLWAEALKSTPDQFGQGPEILSPGTTVAKPVPDSGGEARVERRRYPRYQCAGGLKIRKEGTELSSWAKLTDIGLGGCYAELMSPLPLQTPVDFLIQVDDLVIRGRGMVRTTHPSVGNGIAFTQMGAEDWKRLNQLIVRLANPMARKRPVPAASAADPDAAQTLQVLLELLEKKGVLSRTEFLTELKRFKSRLAK